VSNFFAKVNGINQRIAEKIQDVSRIAFVAGRCFERKGRQKRENLRGFLSKDTGFWEGQATFVDILKMFHAKIPQHSVP